MNKTFKLAAAALCTLLALASCDKNKNNPDDGALPQVVIPETRVESYYWGDYNEMGTGNLIINVVTGSWSVETNMETWEDEYKGTGKTFVFDINIPLSDDPDHVKLVPGEYTVGDDETFAVGTWNCGYELTTYTEVENDKLIHEGELVDGTLTIKEVKGGYEISFEGTHEDETPLSVTVFTEGRAMGRDLVRKYSNLDQDIKVPSFKKGSFENFGDLAEDGMTESIVVTLGDENLDLSLSDGLGDFVYLYFNVEPGSEGIPSGHYGDSWVNIMPEDEEAEIELFPGQLVNGVVNWLFYAGCWYFSPIRGYEVAFVDGYVDVKALGGKSYKISGKLIDAYGKSVEISYQGELLEVVTEDDDELSIKSQNRVPNFYQYNFSSYLQHKMNKR